MYEEKFEFYKKLILDKLYFLTRRSIVESKGWYHLYEKEELVQNPPEDDTYIIDAAWGDLISKYYVEERARMIRFTLQGLIRYEVANGPSITITFNELLIPVLIAQFEYEKSGERGMDYDYLRDFVADHHEIIISENDIDTVMAILGNMNYLDIAHTVSGSIVYIGMRDTGKVKAIKSRHKSPIENAIKRLAPRLFEFDYYEKNINSCSLRLKNWVDQFEDEKEKLAALFLVENLHIVTNEMSNQIWLDYFNENLSNLNQDNIFYCAAGGPGSSGEAWRHKFIRAIDFGKQQSRTLKAIQEKIEESYWEEKYIIFFDDIIGSGDQFKNFFEEYLMTNTGTSYELLDQFESVNIIYFVVVATKEGINYITRNTPLQEENIKYGYLLNKLFDPTNPTWKKTTPVSREVCLQTCQKYGETLYPEYPLGFLDSQLLVAFQDHTPDNTIPVLWMSEDSNWEALLRR